MKFDFNDAKSLVNKHSIYIKNVNLQQSQVKKEDELRFQSYRNISKQRKKSGVNLVNVLMRKFLFKEETKKILINLEKNI
jgi:hypothetical protein